jgi:hypothetical protein
MAVEVMERFVDGLAKHTEYEAAIEAALDARQDAEDVSKNTYVEGDYKHMAWFYAAFSVVLVVSHSSDEWDAADVPLTAGLAVEFSTGTPKDVEHIAQAILVLDIFGNPFRPVLVDPKCLTPTVTSLATAAYEERSLPSGELEPARLAVLADALEEAGCQDPSILAHLRSPGPHVRGCWPLDLILGRA